MGKIERFGRRMVGVDLSITSTGVAVMEGRGPGPVVTSRLRTTPRAATFQGKLGRFQTISGRVLEHVQDGDSLVFLEGPSYGSTGSASHDIAGNWWLLYESLRVWEVRIIVIPPALVKIYATGRGNASKDEVLAATVRRYPSIDIPGNDIADAVVLLAMGCRLAGEPLEHSMPVTHLRALDKVDLKL